MSETESESVFNFKAFEVLDRRYWDRLSIHWLKTANNYDDLARIALAVLAKMPQPAVSVCGPMTTGGLGSTTSNLYRFQWAINHLRLQGLSVFSQMPFLSQLSNIWDNQHLELKWRDRNLLLLESFYSPIFRSDYIQTAYFLPDWENSEGAVWEYNLCHKLGLAIVEPADWWPSS